MDVEFVLGSSPTEDQKVRLIMPLELLVGSKDPKSTFEYVTNASVDFTQRVTNLWPLDFDACSDLTMDQYGVEKACKAFLETEPFCPRPVERSVDPEAADLWLTFGKRYLDTANQFIERRFEQLPVGFLIAVERSHKESFTTESPSISQTSRAERGGDHSGGFGSRGGRRGFRGYSRGGSSRGGRGSRGESGFVSGEMGSVLTSPGVAPQVEVWRKKYGG